jgi:hypothetical protein
VSSGKPGRAFFGSAPQGSSIVIAGGQSAVFTGTQIVYTASNSVEQYSEFGQSTPTQTISPLREPHQFRDRHPEHHIILHTHTPSRTPSYATSFMYAWVLWTPMEISSHHNAFAAVSAGGKIYVMSGIDTEAISVYDPASNVWSTVGETPVGYVHCIFMPRG